MKLENSVQNKNKDAKSSNFSKKSTPENSLLYIKFVSNTNDHCIQKKR